jgi:hypothetical protein
MTDRARLYSVPKLMLPVYEKIVGLTDNVCDKKLNSDDDGRLGNVRANSLLGNHARGRAVLFMRTTAEWIRA